MNNTDTLLCTYNKIYSLGRERFKQNCKRINEITLLFQEANYYFEDHWCYIGLNKDYKKSYEKFKRTLPKYEKELFTMTSFDEIINKLYSIVESIKGTGLASTFCYDVAIAIAYHNNVSINKVYLNDSKTQKAFQNFFNCNNDIEVIEYRNHIIVEKNTFPEALSKLNAEEIEDIIYIYSEAFGSYEWIISDK